MRTKFFFFFFFTAIQCAQSVTVRPVGNRFRKLLTTDLQHIGTSLFGSLLGRTPVQSRLRWCARIYSAYNYRQLSPWVIIVIQVS
jgi:hypothetical protein